MMSKTTEEKLTQAINFLAEYARKHLCDGHQIVLTFLPEEACVELQTDFGDEVDFNPSGDVSGFHEACERSHEHWDEVNSCESED